MSENATETSYFEGTQITQHADGSTTYVTTEHVPYTEPLTNGQRAAIIAVTVGSLAFMLGLPVAVDRLEEWSNRRRAERAEKRAQKAAEDAKTDTKN